MTDQLARVLVADDDPSTREIIVVTLETLGGYQVRAVEAGDLVVDAALEFDPQLILLDSMMPGADGAEVLRQLRQRPEFAATPVIFVTASSSQPEAAALLALGASGIVGKPVVPDRLVERVRTIWWSAKERDRRKRRTEGEEPGKERRGIADAERNEALVKKMATLRENFRESLQSRFDVLVRARTTLSQSETLDVIGPALWDVQHESHKLAGAAATFGFQELSGRARLLEAFVKQLLAKKTAPDASERQSLTQLLQNVILGGAGEESESIVEHTAWNFLRKAEYVRNRGSRTIVVVEDDRTLTQVLSGQLSHFGYDILQLDDPRELEGLVERVKPALVLMDIVFPDDRDAGITQIQDLNARGRLPCPVVYMSVRGDIEARLGAVRAGCDGYLVKPLDLGELLDLVERLTGHDNAGKFRVMIIDDDINVCNYYAMLLSQIEVDTEIVTQPMETLDIIRGFRPDLVLMDIEMPNCSGFELASIIRQDRDFVQIPIVFLSAANVDDAWLDSLRAGGDEFLRKSAPKEEFLISMLARLKRAWALRTTVDHLRLSENRFRAVVESAHYAIITVDDAGRVVFWNRMASRLLGYESAEIIGRSVVDLVPERLRESLVDRVRTMIEGEAPPLSSGILEVTVMRKDGGEFAAELSVSNWRVGDAHYFTAILSDISTRKESELLIKKAKEDAEHAREDAERAREDAEGANRAKTEFLSSMSHELRTPLNAILGFSQILEEDPLTEEQKEFLGMIHKGGEHLLTLIDDVLDLSRIEAGRITLKMDDIAMDLLLSECLTMIDDMARNSRVSVSLGRITPLTVRADLTRLRQVILNLLSNAIKYNRAGGTVSIDVEPESPDAMRLTVTDTGIGIDPDRQGDVFRMFNRLGAENSNIEGTGIGLHFTKRLVELMDGHIEFASEKDVGSRFWIVLPLGAAGNADPAKTPVAAGFTRENEASQTPPKEHLILYIEDNAANVSLMSAALKRLPGVTMISAPDAEQGIAFVETWKPDLILMDINLPGMSGIQALGQLRMNSRTMDIPVFALTAAAMPADVEQGRMAGFNRYLTKPVDLPTVLDAIRQELFKQ